MYGSAASSLTRVEAALIYAPLLAISAALWSAVIVVGNWLLSGHRGRFMQLIRPNFNRRSIFTGIATFTGYGLVLVAMTFATNVGYVVAFRQTSIPLGAVLGMVVLHEARYPAKIVGVATIFAGLVLVSLG